MRHVAEGQQKHKATIFVSLQLIFRGCEWATSELTFTSVSKMRFDARIFIVLHMETSLINFPFSTRSYRMLFLFRACLLGSRQVVFMFVRSVMTTKNNASYVLRTAWSIFWCVALRSYWSTINHSVCLITAMDVLTLSLKTECSTQLDCRAK